MQTFLELKTSLRARIWPDGEAENLVPAHNKNFIEALIKIQRGVKCFQFNNIEQYDPCSILFQCGMSVITTPVRGQIFRVSTYDQINSETCLEDADSPTNWCSEVVYSNLPYCRLKKLMEQMTCNSPLLGNCGYPTPDNAGYAGFPELPLGFQYPQASLDRTCSTIICSSARSRAGVWAYDSGRLYLSPWLQSTERVLIQWNGIRRTWLDTDMCIDFADYEACIMAYMWWQNFANYEVDLEKAAVHKQSFDDQLSDLIWDCRNETRDHSCEPSLAQQSLATLQGQSTGTIAPDTTSSVSFEFSACSESQNNGSSGVVTVYDGVGNVVGTGAIYCSCVNGVCTSTPYDVTLVTGGLYQYEVTVTDGDGGQSQYTGSFVAEDVTHIGITVTTTTTSTATTTSTTTAAPAPANLINISFGSVTTSPKTGLAAIGNNSLDFWNAWAISQSTTALALQYSNNTASPVTIQMRPISATGALAAGTNGNTDAMLGSFATMTESDTFYDSAELGFNIIGLPAGVYDVYYYGWSNATGINGSGCPKGRGYGYVTDTSGAIHVQTGFNNNAPPWIEAPIGLCPGTGNYSPAEGVTISAGEVLGVTMLAFAPKFNDNKPCISGLQIVRRS